MLLESQKLHYSAFLAIKSVKKANFPPFEVLDQVYLLSGELYSLSEAIPLLICVAGVSQPSLIRFLAIKLVKKAKFPPFEVLDQVHLLPCELTNLPEAIPLLKCVVGVSEPSLIRFLAIKSAKKVNFPPFELLDQVYLLSSESSNPPEAMPLFICVVRVSEPSLLHFLGLKIHQKVSLSFKSDLFCNVIVFPLTMPSFFTVVLQIVADIFWLLPLSAKSTISYTE